jgi:guanylate kinase
VSSAKLFVISAPSGCGKGTILERVLKRRDLYYSISYTTREKREGEKEGVNYFFVSKQRFEMMIDGGDFLEYAKYSDNYYGSPKAEILQHLARGTDVVLEIEVDGAFQIKKKFPDAVLVFILPPDVKTLEKRLVGRGTDKPDVIKKRLSRAGREIVASYRYDYAILNDDLDQAVEDLLTLMEGVREQDEKAFQFSTKNDETVKLIEKVIRDA